MNVSQLKPIIIALYNAGRTGMLWGAPGIGKSAAFLDAARAIAKSLGLTGPVLQRHDIREFRLRGGPNGTPGDMRQAFGMFDLRLSMVDPVEVGGLPRENTENGTMEKLPPSWFGHTGRDDLPDYGILLLEELPTAPQSVQATAYQIALDGVIDDFKMKEGWATFAAGNRLSDGGVFTKLSNALANRICHIEVESDVNSWMNWAIDNGQDHSLIAFIRFRTDLLNTYEDHVKNKRAGFAFATERQWEAVNDFLVNNSDAAGSLLVDPATANAIMTGFVGSGPAAEYTGFRDTWHKMPNIDGIILNPDVAVLPEDAATSYAVMTALAGKASYNNLAQCLVYTDRLVDMGRAEMSMLFIRDMQRRQTLLQQAANDRGDRTFQDATMSPAFTVWAQKNADLFG